MSELSVLLSWWGETDNQATTPFGCCPSTAFLPVQPHCTNARWNRCQEDLNSFPLENWRGSPGRPCTTWMNTIQQDLKSNNLSQNEAVESSTLETDVCVWHYTLLVVLARKEEDSHAHEAPQHYTAVSVRWVSTGLGGWPLSPLIICTAFCHAMNRTRLDDTGRSSNIAGPRLCNRLPASWHSEDWKQTSSA